jgi:hypothetical protein
MRRSATSIAANVSALSRKHGATPRSAITAPAVAGPTIRAVCTMTLLSETALTSRSAPTISTTKLWRAGLSAAFTDPRTKMRASTIHVWTTPPAVRAQSVSAGIAMSACVIISRRRFGMRSASRPPHAPATRIGRNWSAAARPTIVPLPVRRRMSQTSATVCIQLPASETTWPVK